MELVSVCIISDTMVSVPKFTKCQMALYVYIHEMGMKQLLGFLI